MFDKFTEGVYRENGGEVIVRRYPQLLASFATGLVTEPMVHWYIREFHAFADVATHRFDIFHDWGKIGSFTPDSRRVFLKWGKERNRVNRQLCRGVHILVESTFIYLAIEAASSFAGEYLTAYRNRQVFELERDRRLRIPSTELISLHTTSIKT